LACSSPVFCADPVVPLARDVQQAEQDEPAVQPANCGGI
jgi:hypothetical protein